MTDIIVIGAGASGMTAALYALRNGKSVLLIEGNGIGGQIAQSPRVENFPTITKISGNELADKLFEQISAKGVQFEFGTVQNIQKKGDTFEVTTDFDTYTAKSVIIAAGVQHRKLHLPKEENLKKITKALNVDVKDLFDFGHVKTKQELVDEMNFIFEQSSQEEVQFFYKVISSYKELK